MKISNLLLSLTIIAISCKTPKTYFSQEIREKVESKPGLLTEIQYYIDRDVELRRELPSRDSIAVASGQVKFENGKIIDVILLKKFTKGICKIGYDQSVKVAFEKDKNETLTFSIENRNISSAIYQIGAQEWLQNNIGRVTYDKKTYFIQPGGSFAMLMIKKSVINKLIVKKRTMGGVDVNKQKKRSP